MTKSGAFVTCLAVVLLLGLASVEAQTICGRFVCMENQYCYNPYPGANRCYPFRNYGQSCYKTGLYLCGPGLECVVPFGVWGTCRYGTASTAAASTAAASTAAGSSAAASSAAASSAAASSASEAASSASEAASSAASTASSIETGGGGA